MRTTFPDQAKVFDGIAPGWYNLRHHTIFSTELATLSRRWQQGKLLNLGCGHGADFVPFKECFELYGVDFSAEMLRLAGKFADKNDLQASFALADMRHLPYPDNFFDHAIAVASLHHLPGPAQQLKALGELQRVLKPGSECFITVWNRCQRRFWFKPKEVTIPWQSSGVRLERYYYLFSYSEIQNLVRLAGFNLIKSFPENSFHGPLKHFSRNICLLIIKPN